MSFIPKVSAPLAKDIRTGEGVAFWLTSVGVAVTAAIDPTVLPVKWAATLVTVNAALQRVSRTLLKVVAIQKGVGVDQPINFDPIPSAQAGELAAEAVGVLESAVKPDLPKPASAATPAAAVAPVNTAA